MSKGARYQARGPEFMTQGPHGGRRDHLLQFVHCPTYECIFTCIQAHTHTHVRMHTHHISMYTHIHIMCVDECIRTHKNNKNVIQENRA